MFANEDHIHLSQGVVIRPKQSVKQIIDLESTATHFVDNLVKYWFAGAPKREKGRFHNYNLAMLQHFRTTTNRV